MSCSFKRKPINTLSLVDVDLPMRRGRLARNGCLGEGLGRCQRARRLAAAAHRPPVRAAPSRARTGAQVARVARVNRIPLDVILAKRLPKWLSMCIIHTNDQRRLDTGHAAGRVAVGPRERFASHLQAPEPPRHRGGAASQEGLGARAGQSHPAAGRYLKGPSMRYPITIEPGTDTAAWGVVVPDLPGCFSAGDTLEDAMVQAEEAITGWIEAAIDAGQDIPAPSHIEALRAAHPELEGWLWALVKVDPAMLDDTLERVNISLPRRVLHRLDARARRAGETRSAFIARMAIEEHE